MSYGELDGASAISEAAEIMERSRRYLIEIPLGVCCDIGDFISTIAEAKHLHSEDITNELRVSKRINEVIPANLQELDIDENTGEITTPVEPQFSYDDVECIATCAYNLPTVSNF